jgi:hypothetical protein
MICERDSYLYATPQVYGFKFNNIVKNQTFELYTLLSEYIITTPTDTVNFDLSNKDLNIFRKILVTGEDVMTTSTATSNILFRVNGSSEAYYNNSRFLTGSATFNNTQTTLASGTTVGDAPSIISQTSSMYRGHFELELTNFNNGYLSGFYKYNSATVILGYMSYTQVINTITSIALLNSSGDFCLGKFQIIGCR